MDALRRVHSLGAATAASQVTANAPSPPQAQPLVDDKGSEVQIVSPFLGLLRIRTSLYGSL